MQSLEAEIKGPYQRCTANNKVMALIAHSGKVIACSCGQMPEARIISS